MPVDVQNSSVSIGEAEMSLALTAIRVLRFVPRTPAFDAHLDRCAAIEVLHVPYDDRFSPLGLAHIVGIVPLPDFLPSFPDKGNEGIHCAVPCDDIVEGR